jgi:hypothetical protein
MNILRFFVSGVLRFCVRSVALLALVVGLPAHAGTNLILEGAPYIFAGAGFSNAAIDTVNFQVNGADVGSGNPTQGGENGLAGQFSLIDALGRAPGGAARTVFWVVDSSQPLTCATPITCGSTTIPMTKFRWTTPAGSEIGSNTFSGAPNQPLHSFQTSRYVYTYQTFYFVNDAVFPAGRYTGRVVYTVSMP